MIGICVKRILNPFCFFENQFFPFLSRLLIPLFIVTQPRFTCDHCARFQQSLIDRNCLPVVDIPGADSTFYRLFAPLPNSAIGTSKGSGRSDSFFNKTIASSATFLARTSCTCSRMDVLSSMVPLYLHSLFSIFSAFPFKMTERTIQNFLPYDSLSRSCLLFHSTKCHTGDNIF